MELKLSFDRPDKIYSAGDIIKCSINIRITKEIKCRSISMRFLGIGTTEFEIHNKVKKKCSKIVHSKSYTGYEEYFRHYKYFIGSKGALETTIIPGDYLFAETYELPPNIPADFDGDYGSIKYLVRVKIENNWTSDQMIVDTFHVKPVLNVIHDNRYTAVEQRNQKYFHSWWFHRKSKPVEISATLASGIFVVGDTINLSVNVENNSNIRIKHFMIKLEQCITFRGSFNASEVDVGKKGVTIEVKNNQGGDQIDTNEMTSNRVLWSKIFPVQIQARQRRNFIAEVPLPLDNYIKLLPGSKLMQSEFFIRLVGVVGRFHTNPELAIKFKIATAASEV